MKVGSYMQFNSRLNQIKPSPIRSFNDQISSIEGLLALTIGEPDFHTSEPIKLAAIKAINHNLNGYSHSKGLLELRQAISSFLERKYQLSYNPEDEIIVTAGPTQALFTSFMTILNPGDKVIAASPTYVIYSTQVQLAQASFVPIDVSQTNFRLTPDLLEEALAAHPETKAILLNHPSNPTGVTYTREELEALVPIIKKHQLWVVSDEIYSELTYDHQHTSFASLLREQTILINGLSKSHAMTGWRSGFLAAPRNVMTQLFKVSQATINNPNRQMQYASIEAYLNGDDFTDKMKEEYKSRRDFLVKAFNQMGITSIYPQGAFYLFVKVPEWFNGSDFDFCLKLAQEARVGTVPGSGFGEAGRQYFRISYATRMAVLEEAVRRISTFVKNNHP